MRLVPGLLFCLGILLILSLNNSGVARHGLQAPESYDTPGPVAVIPHGEPGVFTLDDAALFERLTAQNIGSRLVMVMDDVVLTTPVIQDKINGGKLVVTGNFTITALADSGAALRAALLPLPFSALESRVTAPATGKGVGS